MGGSEEGKGMKEDRQSKMERRGGNERGGRRFTIRGERRMGGEG